MPIIAMPDGTQVQFPDDMPREQIQGLILQKFPDAAGAPSQPPTQPTAAPAPEQWQQPGSIVPIQFPADQNTNGGWPRLAMPQIITDAFNAAQAPGKAMRGGYDQVELNTQTGEVSPFDPRMMDDAANLASMTLPLGVASRAAPAARAATKALPTPTIDDLYATKAAAYKTVDQLGARYSQQAVDDLAGDMIRRASASNISPTRHPKAYSMLVDLQSNPRAMSLTELDQLRQVIRRDLISGGDQAEGHFGQEFIRAIDDFVDNAGPGQISGVEGQTASYAIRTARQQNSILRKSETLQSALENARLRAASTGSGGNIDNAIRQELVKIVKSDNLSRGFSKEELAQMERIITGGGKLQDFLRLVGKLSPSGNGLMAALSLGATAANPLLAAAPAAGLVAKALSDRATRSGTEQLTNTVRNGGLMPMPQIGGPRLPRAAPTLLQQNFGAPAIAFPASVPMELRS